MMALPLWFIYCLFGFGGLALGLIIGWFLASKRGHDTAPETKAFLSHLMHNQHELKGKLDSLTQVVGTGQHETTKHLGERLDHLSHRLGQNMTETSQATIKSLSTLNERMAVIDSAQQRLGQLSESMVDLQSILTNKQSRGAFGQARMEAIIRDALPKSAYEFQPTLKNKTRPDCLIALPSAQEKLVVDAKFPLEAFTSFREAETPDDVRSAKVMVKETINKHIQDIASRYLIPGETQEMALMFVPSESLYADLYESFYDIMQKAYRQNVMIVGPSLLMLAVQLMQTMVRDARMREQAGFIKNEVMKLLVDVSRLDERVNKLQNHFRQADKDIEDIMISTNKIRNRSSKIEMLEVKPLAAETDVDNLADERLVGHD